MQCTRTWIGRLFWAGAVLTFVGLLSCVIALVLQIVGDRVAASGVWGVFLVSAAAWLINFIVVVALLAWRVMKESDSVNTPGR